MVGCVCQEPLFHAIQVLSYECQQKQGSDGMRISAGSKTLLFGRYLKIKGTFTST